MRQQPSWLTSGAGRKLSAGQGPVTSSVCVYRSLQSTSRQNTAATTTRQTTQFNIAYYQTSPHCTEFIGASGKRKPTFLDSIHVCCPEKAKLVLPFVVLLTAVLSAVRQSTTSARRDRTALGHQLTAHLHSRR